MRIMGHSDKVGMGAASVATPITGPNGSVINPNAEFESPVPPSTIEYVTVLPETETRFVQSTQAPLMSFRYLALAGNACGYVMEILTVPPGDVRAVNSNTP